MRLSVSMIVKNEESCLAKCMGSVVGADELVVVDTGSTDRTKEIAAEFGAKLSDFAWCDDYAAARNFALAQCSGDWVLSIDADEELEPGGIDKVRAVISQAAASTKRIGVVMRAAVNGDEHPLGRLFRRDPGVRWEGEGHEAIGKIESQSGIVIKYGYSPTHKTDPDRMLRIMGKAVIKNPRATRSVFYLAREYWYRKDYETAVKWLDDYFLRATFGPEMAEAALLMARCYLAMGQIEKAKDACLQAIKVNADFEEALRFMAQLSGPNNRAKWNAFADLATNKFVLFNRCAPKRSEASATPQQVAGKPLDLDAESLAYFERLLLRRGHTPLAVLEWGAGASTKYFTDLLARAGVPFTWDAMEHDPVWASKVRAMNISGATVTLADKDSEAYLTPPKRKYDLIYVDGRNRVQCLRAARGLLAPGGAVLLHDAQRARYRPGFEGYAHREVGGEVKLWHGWIVGETIPRMIHQVWIGPKPAPEEWIDTWHVAHPGWQHELWDENRIDAFSLVNREQYDRYVAAGCYNGACNVARAEILLRLGGVYIDADSACKYTMEGAPFMGWDFFTVYEADDLFIGGKRLIANGIIGARPGHPYLARLVARIGQAAELNPSWRKTGPLLWTEVVGDDPGVLPPYTFLPVHHSGHHNRIGGTVYAEQFWGTTREIQATQRAR
ncbi:MAG: glycosyltransferase [Kiritimatiellia bacterium]|jgi:glycosyltransferase involved in cell wall biosynthesis